MGYSVVCYVLSLTPLTPLTLLTLCSALLALLACSVHGLAHSLCSLPCGTVEIPEYVFTLKTSLVVMDAFFVFTINTP